MKKVHGNEIFSGYNGNCKITIYEDGTKVRETSESEFSVEFPETIDLKITDYCNAGCVFCHESSTTKGVHADLSVLKDIADIAQPGIEFAIGGGNPMSHPNLEEFLSYCLSKGIICNLTVNELHINKYKDVITDLQNRDLIKGLGISSVNPNNTFKNMFKNVVMHYILGVTKITHNLKYSSFSKEKSSNEEQKDKILFLGYKEFGRGKAWKYSENRKSKYLREELSKIEKDSARIINFLLKNNYLLCFDNLAIEQLRLKEKLSKEQFDNFYMGDDGQFSMYIDAVKEEYAKTSRSEERNNLYDDDGSIKKLDSIFKDIKTESKTIF